MSGHDDDRELQRERAAALKHDLGKYVAWRSANMPESAWSGPLDATTRESLQADILRTRSANGVDEPAWALFERLVREWAKPWPDELVKVERAVAKLREHGDALRDGGALPHAELYAAQLVIRSELAALVRRLAKEE
ncbi:MAG TPA: hypothetical protein VG755_17135 [Nannocystaceae bacterium]|nr:hypothetical protein [Nannocystaceae bacterium]